MKNVKSDANAKSSTFVKKCSVPPKMPLNQTHRNTPFRGGVLFRTLLHTHLNVHSALCLQTTRGALRPPGNLNLTFYSFNHKTSRPRLPRRRMDAVGLVGKRMLWSSHNDSRD